MLVPIAIRTGIVRARALLVPPSVTTFTLRPNKCTCLEPSTLNIILIYLSTVYLALSFHLRVGRTSYYD